MISREIKVLARLATQFVKVLNLIVFKNRFPKPLARVAISPVHGVLRIKNFLPPPDPLHQVQHMNTQTLHIEQTLKTLGGRVTCQRCQAKSKRTKLQCAAPALKGKRVCKTHGGRSTGPKTEAGRQRCAEAKTIHGRETREARNERSFGLARIAVLREVGFALGFMSGTRTRGRRPARMAKAYPELQIQIKTLRKSIR